MSDVTIAVLTAGVSDPSSSRLLADRAAQRTADALGAYDLSATFRSIDLSTIAVDIAQALVSGMPNRKVTAAIDALAESDAIIASTPVYKAGISGLFKSFADLLDNDLLIAKPVLLAATGGTSRHAMVVDEQLRPLFAFLRAIPMPTSLYAAPEDWGSPDLGDRTSRAAGELAIFLRNGTGPQIAEQNWGRHRHQFGGTAAGAPQSVDDVDFSTDLMRLAAGGEREQGT
ncbi:MAG TPA: CE1759 family FMN reductase [Nocardioides sp.]